MSITVSPTLTVAGSVVSVADPAAGLVAIDTLSIPWGRDSVLDVPKPSTCSLRLLDSTAGATFARRADLIGQLVVAGWSCSDGPTGTNFRGRITDVEVTPRRSGGFYVALSATSKEADAGNYTAPEGTVWPAETFGARLGRIVGLMPAGLFAGGVHMPGRFDAGVTDVADPTKDFADYPVKPADVGGRSALELLREFWASVSVLPLRYDPAADELGFAARRRWTYNNLVGGAVVARLAVADPDRPGKYVAVPDRTGSVPIRADRLGYAGALTQPLESRVTRVEVAYTAAGATDQTTTTATTTAAALESTIGRRTLAVTSIHSDAGYAAQLAGQWRGLLDAEGRRPRLGPLQYTTSERTPFPSSATAAVVLWGREADWTVFLGGSWLPRLGERPVVAFVGGTITYRGGQWDVSLTPAPVSVEATTTPLPIRYASAGVVTLAQLDDSVTIGDLGFVEVGPGYTTTTQPPWGTP